MSKERFTIGLAVLTVLGIGGCFLLVGLALSDLYDSNFIKYMSLALFLVFSFVVFFYQRWRARNELEDSFSGQEINGIDVKDVAASRKEKVTLSAIESVSYIAVLIFLGIGFVIFLIILVFATVGFPIST